LVNAEDDAFRGILSGWVGPHGMDEVRSVADLKRLVTEWDGSEPPIEAWNAARTALENRARSGVEQLRVRAKAVIKREREKQREAALLRLIDELGRLLICSSPDTDDLNGKFHRLASEAIPTAERLKIVFKRLGTYPDWDSNHLAELRAFRNSLTPAQVRTRLTGRELEAALMDPRWEVGITAGSLD
jgi:hypothetical protein